MTKTQADPDFRRQLDGYALATAEITYRMPDARSILQTFLWQDYDIAPEFPNLCKFLDFWERELDGPIHSVRLAHSNLLGPAGLRMVDREYFIH
ncbi:MAG: aspartate-semialdehyde dehydrogenase [Pseudomonadota bacterium]